MFDIKGDGWALGFCCCFGNVAPLVGGADIGVENPGYSSGDELYDAMPLRCSPSSELSEGVFFRKRDMNVFRLGPAEAGGEMLVWDLNPLNEPLFLGLSNGDLADDGCGRFWGDICGECICCEEASFIQGDTSSPFGALGLPLSVLRRRRMPKDNFELERCGPDPGTGDGRGLVGIADIFSILAEDCSKVGLDIS